MILPIVIGGIIAYFIHKKLKARSNSEEDFENQKTPGVLVASGLIVGEALMSIFIAGGIGATGDQNFISLVSSSYGDIANYVGLIIFIIGLLISFTSDKIWFTTVDLSDGLISEKLELFKW